MVFSPQQTIQVDDFDVYLHQVERTIKSLDFSRSNYDSSAIASLKQTLTSIEVAQIKQTAISDGVWDFYPTNNFVIDKMLKVAQLQPHHRVLEPSAGTGDLCSAIAESGVEKIDCFELHPLLQQALRLQDFNLIGADFLASIPQPLYDRIIANPPFGNNGVARHTQHAFQFLKPGGKLITLAHHYQLKPSHTDKQFFYWLKQHQAKFLNLGTAFVQSNRPTKVPIQLIKLDKP